MNVRTIKKHFAILKYKLYLFLITAASRRKTEEQMFMDRLD